MKKILGIAVLITFLSCQTTTPTDTVSVKDNITYFKDERTGLCFATVSSVSEGYYPIASITCVPCDSVNKLIK